MWTWLPNQRNYTICIGDWNGRCLYTDWSGTVLPNCRLRYKRERTKSKGRANHSGEHTHTIIERRCMLKLKWIIKNPTMKVGDISCVTVICWRRQTLGKTLNCSHIHNYSRIQTPAYCKKLGALIIKEGMEAAESSPKELMCIPAELLNLL